MSSNNYNSKNSKGVGLLTVIGIVFIILKLCGVIRWKWFWVLCPFWVGVIGVIVSLIIAFIMAVMIKKSNKL